MPLNAPSACRLCGRGGVGLFRLVVPSAPLHEKEPVSLQKQGGQLMQTRRAALFNEVPASFSASGKTTAQKMAVARWRNE